MQTSVHVSLAFGAIRIISSNVIVHAGNVNVDSSPGSRLIKCVGEGESLVYSSAVTNCPNSLRLCQ